MPMQSAVPMQSRKCGRRTRGEYPCKNWALPGQTVCRMHGGKAPRALANAEERMRAMIHPALDSLKRQIDKDEFAATRYVLDWALHPDAENDDATAPPMRITVVFDRADQDNEITPTLSLNGHTSA